MPVPLADKEKTWILIIPIKAKTKMFAYKSWFGGGKRGVYGRGNVLVVGGGPSAEMERG